MQLTRRTTLAILAAVVATPVLAAMPAQYTKGGFAIGGYDPVAYFTESDAYKGSAQHSLSWNGATWRFASAENKKLFEADPEKYAPQYGGYCAYAMASGDLVSINPKSWDIHNGKLYLNYSSVVWAIWSRNKKGYISRADGHWPNVSKGLS